MTEGLTLGDRYELGELLGRGGMAEVFRARDLRLGRNVAVKMLRVDLARDPSFERRFQREAEAAAGMNHPNVVAVFDTGSQVMSDVEVPYIVMEYVDGTTLRDLLSTGRRLLPRRAMEVAAGTLAALDYSHSQGIVHRDIKPANVMLTRTGEVKVMDFGIARAVADSSATMTQTSTVLGTAQYLSPEQGRGEQVDGRSDIYSAGCLLYELLTSRPPFTGDSTASVVYQHVRENPIPPSQIDPEVPSAADAIVMKAMAKNPENRYQTAGEMRADVLRAIEGEPVSATAVMDQTQAMPAASVLPIDPTADAVDSKNRRGAYIALAIAAVLALLVGGFFLLRPLLNTDATVQVPDVAGKTQTEATKALQAANLKLGTTTNEASDNLPKGLVIRTDPASFAEVAEGTAVNLVISTGPAQTTVPALTGLSLDEANQALTTNQLKLGKREEKSSDKPAGTVLDSDPAEGTNVAVGTTVNLVVSSGKISVPDVVGDTEANAKSALTAAGFKVEVVKSKTNASPPGIVIDQSPKADTKASVNATVTITVSEAAPVPTTAPSTPGGNQGSPAPTP